MNRVEGANRFFAEGAGWLQVFPRMRLADSAAPMGLLLLALSGGLAVQRIPDISRKTQRITLAGPFSQSLPAAPAEEAA